MTKGEYASRPPWRTDGTRAMITTVTTTMGTRVTKIAKTMMANEGQTLTRASIIGSPREEVFKAPGSARAPLGCRSHGRRTVGPRPP